MYNYKRVGTIIWAPIRSFKNHHIFSHLLQTPGHAPELLKDLSVYLPTYCSQRIVQLE